jgi:hypothetical protein
LFYWTGAIDELRSRHGHKSCEDQRGPARPGGVPRRAGVRPAPEPGQLLNSAGFE